MVTFFILPDANLRDFFIFLNIWLASLATLGASVWSVANDFLLPFNTSLIRLSNCSFFNLPNLDALVTSFCKVCIRPSTSLIVFFAAPSRWIIRSLVNLSVPLVVPNPLNNLLRIPILSANFPKPVVGITSNLNFWPLALSALFFIFSKALALSKGDFNLANPANAPTPDKFIAKLFNFCTTSLSSGLTANFLNN